MRLILISQRAEVFCQRELRNDGFLLNHHRIDRLSILVNKAKHWNRLGTSIH